MKILIAYATTEGQTRKICRYCADLLVDSGHSVELLEVRGEDKMDLGRFDAAILAASVHLGSYQRDMAGFVRANATGLAVLRTLFVAVSLAAAGQDAEDRAELEAIAERFFDETHWQPGQVAQVAGAFRFTEYDFFKAWAMRWIATQKGEDVDPHQDKEYTDWAALKTLILNWAG